jgi:hypothetical protein
VRVANAPVARSPSSRSGGHLHLFVDGRLEQMPYGTESELRLEPGRHRITVEYVNFEHVSFEPRVVAPGAGIVSPDMGIISYQEVPGEITLDPVGIVPMEEVFPSEENRMPAEQAQAMAAA